MEGMFIYHLHMTRIYVIIKNVSDVKMETDISIISTIIYRVQLSHLLSNRVSQL